MALNRAQKKSLAIGFAFIFAAGLVVALIWAGTYLPGFAGEVFSMIAGIMWTPILLDLTIFIMGGIFVLWLNHFIRAREGDEFVYLEQVDGPDIPADLPAEARAAVFTEEPETQGLAPALAAIEGALELDDRAEASELLYQLPPDSLDEPEVLALRIRLAWAHGRDEQARALEDKLDTILQNRRRRGTRVDPAGG